MYIISENGLNLLVLAGKNPMIAYIAVNMLVMPIINLLGLTKYLDLFNENAWLGFLRGVINNKYSGFIGYDFFKIKIVLENLIEYLSNIQDIFFT